jgi:hypothetical protein
MRHPKQDSSTMKFKIIAMALVAACLASPASAGQAAVKDTAFEMPAQGCKSFRRSTVSWDCGRMPATDIARGETRGAGRSR